MTSGSRRFWLWLSLAIAAAVALAFGRAVGYGIAPIDDYDFVVGNPALRAFSATSLRWIFTHFDPELYIPLTFLSFMIEHAVAGSQTWLYHFDNLLLHAGSALLVAMIIGDVTRSRTAGACAALLFTVHPLMTEPVVWISGRKDVLSGFLALLSTLLMLRGNDGHYAVRWGSVALFVFALLAKPSVIALPLVWFCILRIAGQRRSRALRIVAPGIVASCALGAVAVIGKAEAISATPLFERLMLAFASMALILGRVFWPPYLGLYYDVPEGASAVMLAAVPVALALAAFLLRRRMPLLSLGIAWTFLMLLPATLNVQTDVRAAGATFAADRYAYLAIIGVLIAAIGLLRALPEDIGAAMRRRIALGMTALAVITGLILSFRQTAVWATPVALFEHAVAVTPSSVPARTALARVLLERNDTEGAFAVLKEGLRYGEDARLHLAAGLVYAKAGQVPEAQEQFERARTMDPDMPEAAYALGQLRERAGDLRGARILYEQALALEPEYPEVRARLQALGVELPPLP